MDLSLVQLIAENAWQETREPDAQGDWVDSDFDWMRTTAGLARLAELVDGIGPQYPMLFRQVDDGEPALNSLVADAHAAGLRVHPYTLRADQLPAWADSHDSLMHWLVDEAGVDGVFTDFPDLARAWLKGRE